MVGSWTFTKTFWRTLFTQKGRYLGSVFITLLSLFLTAGLGSLGPSLGNSFLSNYNEPVPDLIVKSKAATGFTADQIQSITSVNGAVSSDSLMSIDSQEGDEYYRFYFVNIQQMNSAKPALLEGTYPKSRGEILTLEGNNTRKAPLIGETLNFSGLSFFAPSSLTVTGIARSNLYLHHGKNLANIENNIDNKIVSGIYFVEASTMPAFLQNWKNEIYLHFNTSNAYFSHEYKTEMEQKKADVRAIIGENDAAILTLEENESYILYKSYQEKVTILSYLIPFFFLLLCALVNSTTINRLMKDERGQIATCVSQGVQRKKILGKYLWFSFTAVLIGAAIGYFAGVHALPWIIYPAYNAVFTMGPVTISLLSVAGIVTAVSLIAVSLLVTLVTALRYLGESPADLLKEPAPKAGKKILLERVGFIWNHLSFSVKSMFRNLFRLKKNFFLTFVSVIGSTLLVFLGFGLLNVSSGLLDNDLFATVASSMGFISTVIVILAAAMTVAVVYLLANMNIEDRKRELATLKVLGYSEKECNLYCFREIIFVAVLGSLISLPIDLYVCDWVFTFLGFGSISQIQWWTYVASPVIVIVSAVVVDFFLRHRIKAIDTTTSLKSVE